MLHQRGNAGKPVDEDWHAFRARARKTAFSQEEFSDIDQERYDLDTARITGEDNPESYDGEDDGIRDVGEPKADVEGAGDPPWV